MELREEVESIRLSTEYKSLIETKQVEDIGRVDMLSATKIRGWLFNFYSIIGDYNSYENINNRMRSYLGKVKNLVTSEEINYRNLIILQRRIQDRV